MVGVSHFNNGTEDALLLDGSRSVLTYGGYVRVADHAIEYKDVDSHITPNLGNTLEFIIPKAADLLGCCDLMLEFAQPTHTPGANTYAAWVESIGFAMIDKIEFTVGSHIVETLSGDHLNIMNELMKRPEQKLGNKLIGKTGDSAVKLMLNATTGNTTAAADLAHGRLITFNGDILPGKKLIVPLGLFFTKHPSLYFPIGAIAGVNEVRISVKLRQSEDLIVMGPTDFAIASGHVDKDDNPSGAAVYPTWTGSAIKSARLRCHFAHVTGPEATRLISQEHVRLLRQWQDGGGAHNFSVLHAAPTFDASYTAAMINSAKPVSGGANFTLDINLSFLHPVQELIITIRKRSEMSTSKTSSTNALKDREQHARVKNRFAYHGSGRDPNVESADRMFKSNFITATGANGDIQFDANAGEHPIELNSSAPGHHTSFLDVQSFKLLLNGQDKHPSLAADGLDKEYLMERLMPMLHSSTDATSEMVGDATSLGEATSDVLKKLHELQGRKEIYVYPFCLNPEGSNPSGHVNFSKVSHAKLTIKGKAYSTAAATADLTEDYQVDVYGISFNWAQIKDGRALVAFA